MLPLHWLKNAVAFITINRPEAMNALNEVVVSQLEKRFSEAESNSDVKAIVFQGAGKAFIAGADLRYFVDKIKSDRISDIETFTRKGQELLLRIENSAKQTIALLDGLSLGGGSELALACQKILATPNGMMGFPETGIGIFPGLGGMLRLAKHVGPALAKYYIFTGGFLNAGEAQELGIISKLSPVSDIPSALEMLIAEGKVEKYKPRKLPEKFINLAKAFENDNSEKLLSGTVRTGVAEDIDARIWKSIEYKAPLALQTANKIIDQQIKLSIKEGMELELVYLKDIFSTADALEGLQASLEQRRPVFKGA